MSDGGMEKTKDESRELRNPRVSMKYAASSRILEADPTHDLADEGGLQTGIPTTYHEIRKVEEDHGSDDIRTKVVHFLHNPWIQGFLVVLLLLDVIFLFTELALLTFFPSCDIITRDGISCCPATGKEDDPHRWLGEEEAHHFCENGAVENFDYNAGCDHEKWFRVHRTENALFWSTIAILSIFFVELCIMWWALGTKVFFRQVFYILDFVIVSVSLGLELSFHFIHEDTLASLAGLLILARVWRIIRIGHGIIEVIADITREKYEILVIYTKELEAVLNEKGIPLPDDAVAKKGHELGENHVSHNHHSHNQNHHIESIEEEVIEA